jgi:hypothetical protein
MTVAPDDGVSFDSWVRDLPDRFIDCRNDNHRWRTLRIDWDADHHNYRKNDRCTNCRTERERRIGRDGAVLSNRYSYPDQYLAPKGVGAYDKDSRAEMRLSGIMRWIDKHSPAEFREAS